MKKGLIIGLVVVLGVVIIGLVTFNIVNDKADEQLTVLIDKKIKENRLEEILKYDDLDISSTKGLLIISGLEFIDDGAVINIETINVEIPKRDLINLAKDPNNAKITDLKVTIFGIKISDVMNSFNLEANKLSAHIKGNINTSLFNEWSISKDSDFELNILDMENSGVVLTTDIGALSFDNLSFGINGILKFSDLEKDFNDAGYLSLLNIFKKISLNFNGFNYEASQEIKQGLTMMGYMFLGDVSLVKNQENWAIDNLELKAESEDNKISIKNLELKTNWINMNIKASATIDDFLESFTPLNFELTMNDYIEDLRPIFEMFISEITDQTLPKDKFLLSVSIEDESSLPEVIIENLN